MPLTKRQVDAAHYDGNGPTQQIVYDDEIPMFGIRLNPGGSKSFILRYRDPRGRDRMLTLGRYGPLTLAQGRKLARDKYLEIRSGSDPRQEAIHARSAALTVGNLLDEYLQRHAKLRRRSWREDARRIESRLKPAIGSLLVDELDRSRVHDLHAEIAQRGPVEANRCIALLRSAYNWGVDLELISCSNPATSSSRRRYSWQTKERSRERVLTPDEMRRLVEAIDAEHNPWSSGGLWLGLLTGFRKSDLLARRWSEVDHDARTISFTTSKDQVPRTIPFSALAWEKLNDIPRQSGCDFVFCSTRAGERLKDIKKVWERVRKAADLEDVVFHDLRRTLTSWLASDGTSDRIIKEILGHSDPTATGVYARVSVDAVREGLDAYARLVADILTAESTLK